MDVKCGRLRRDFFHASPDVALRFRRILIGVRELSILAKGKARSRSFALRRHGPIMILYVRWSADVTVHKQS